jgi:uncharacterized protein DUF5946
MPPNQAATERCDGCGLQAPGGAAGCQRILDEILARDFTDARYFSVHRMLIDTYCLQHPERYCASAKSLAAHLTGLAWLIERGGGKAVGHEPLRRWLDGAPRLERPEIPGFRGGLTIADVRGAEDAAGHARAVEAWARSTWEAYAPLHETARAWIEQALRTPRARSR